ncbi:MAG: hypothetical protein EAZ24_08230, partial [Burkholderiales bacterium]
MKYCARAETATVAQVIVVSDPEITCASINAVDWSMPSVFPPISFAEGVVLAAAVCGVWLVTIPIR